MPNARQLLVPAALAAALTAVLTSAQTGAPTFFTATLAGANERPNAVQTRATGSVTAVLDGNTLIVGGTFSGLSGPATASHVHGPAGRDAAAGVLFPLAVSAAAAGNVGGMARLSADQVAQLTGGRMYVNVHTAANPGGEIRGQLEARAGGSSAAAAATSSVPACPAEITIKDYAFNPPACSVKAGATVTWKNLDPEEHTATSDPGAPAAFDTGLLAEGKSGRVTFAKAGTYAYHCTPHAAGMKATIVVQ
jgi:plastocyanin